LRFVTLLRVGSRIAMVMVLLGPALAMAFRSTSSPATSGASHTGVVAEVQIVER
jgi:hypothetical protein